jgi:hypothetical protein
MPIIPQWYDETKTVYLLQFTADGIQSWDEYRQAIDAALVDIMAVDHPVIVYFSPDKSPMPPGNPLPHVRYALGQVPPHVVAVINIVNNHFAATIMQWLLQIGRYRWCHIVSSKQEAEALVARLKSELQENGI